MIQKTGNKIAGPLLESRPPRRYFSSFERQGKGDHEIWYSPLTRRSVVYNNIQSRHTANGVLKQAGLPKSF